MKLIQIIIIPLLLYLIGCSFKYIDIDSIKRNNQAVIFGNINVELEKAYEGIITYKLQLIDINDLYNPYRIKAHKNGDDYNLTQILDPGKYYLDSIIIFITKKIRLKRCHMENKVVLKLQYQLEMLELT